VHLEQYAVNIYVVVDINGRGAPGAICTAVNIYVVVDINGRSAPLAICS